MGLSGRKAIEALIAGEKDPAKLARLADPRVKTSQQSLHEALRGRVTKSHRFLLHLHLAHIDTFDAAFAELNRQVEAGIAPFRTAVEQITTASGVKSLTARTILPEIGTDMSPFPTSGHLISWACICPRNDETAGKRRWSRIRKGSPWLKTTLVQCAWAAARTKGLPPRSIAPRPSASGPKKAILAVAVSSIYHMLKDGTLYQDPGPNHFDARTKERQKIVSLSAWPTCGTPLNLSPKPVSVEFPERVFLLRVTHRSCLPAPTVAFLRDRRAVALTESGKTRREKELARSGNAVRRGMIQLAWHFLGYQKESALPKWFEARTKNARGSRKKMIVALARKLLVALWHFVRGRVVPEGVVLRPAH